MYETFKDVNKEICNQMLKNSQCQCYENETPKQFKDLTWREKTFKGQKISLSLFGKKEDLSDLQLLVYVNNELKYATKKGVFKIKTYKVSRIVFRGWLPEVETNVRETLIFKNEKDFNRFNLFIRKLRDCILIDETFHDLCLEYCRYITQNLGDTYTKTIG